MRRYLEREIVDNFPANYEDEHGWVADESHMRGRHTIKSKKT